MPSSCASSVELLAAAAGDERRARPSGQPGAVAASRAIRASTAFECAARRRAAQQHRVAGLQAQRRGVDRHVRPRLVDDGDHAQRDSNLAELEPVRPGGRRRRPRRPGPAAPRSPARRRRSRARAPRRAPAGPSARPRARTRARPRGRARWPPGSPAVRASSASAIARSAASLVAESTVASRRAAALAASARSVTERSRSDGGGHGESLGSRGRMTTILRARVAHTPRDPFSDDDALETFDDGAVAFDGRHDRRHRRRSPTSAARLPGRRGARPPRLHPAAGLRRHPRPLPADRRDRRDGAAAARLARPSARCRRRRGWPTPAHARRTRRALRASPRAQRDDVRARVRRALPGRAERAVRGGRARRAADRERARGLRPQPAPRARGHARAGVRAQPRRCATAGTAAAGCATPSRRASACPAPRRCSRPAARCSTSAARCSRATSTRARARSTFVRELFPKARDYVGTYERRRAAARVLGARPQRARLRRRARPARGVADRRRALPVVRTRSWPRASSRWPATSSTACASGWAPTSAPAPA